MNKLLSFMFTILFRWGYATGRFRWFDGVIKSAGGGERGTKKKKGKKGGKEEEKNKFKIGALGNLSDLKYNLMEACKTIEGFDVHAYGNVHRQHMLDFIEAYPKVSFYISNHSKIFFINIILIRLVI